MRTRNGFRFVLGLSLITAMLLAGCPGNDPEICAVEDSPTLAGIIDEDRTIPYDASCSTVLVTADVFVRSGATLTVEPGVTLVFTEETALSVEEDSALVAAGTAERNITFTGLEKIPGYWMGVAFSSSANALNTLDHVVIEYGGSDYWYVGDDFANLVVDDATVAISNTTLREGQGYGFYFYLSDVTRFDDNVVTQNATAAGYLYANDVGALSATSTYTGNDVDRIDVWGGLVDQDQTWAAQDVEYLILSNTEVTATLTIGAGATLAFAEDTGLSIEATGALVADGAQASILFTGDQPESGFWHGIAFNGSISDANRLAHATVEYAGSGYWYYSDDICNIVAANATVTLENVMIRNSGGWGVYSYQSDLTITDCTYSSNAEGDLFETP